MARLQELSGDFQSSARDANPSALTGALQ
jgi:hypothetical protein